MTRQLTTRLTACAVVLLALAGTVAAQPNLPSFDDAQVRAAFETARQTELAAIKAAAGNQAALTAIYARILDRVIDSMREPVRSSAEWRELLRAQAAAQPDSAEAKSFDAGATNPGTISLLERSGMTDLLAFVKTQNFVSTDQSAVVLNLNAFALARDTSSGKESAQYVYGTREQWRRLAGSVSFGAKVPEKAITGLNGLPDSDTLFDAFAWDVKLRAYGDRDPRATRWYELFLDGVGGVLELATRLSGLAPTEEEKIAALAIANARVKKDLAAAQRAVAGSLQITGKFAGQHLNEQKNLNKYSAAVLLDKGVGALDLTANITYSAADAPAVAGSDPFRTKDWTYAAGLTGSVLKGWLAADRSVELSAALSGIVPLDDDAVPVSRKRIIKVNGTVTFPFKDKARIPFSVTYSNDPNNLTKEKYVSGQIGISYDFSALKGLK
jgi:hypothetical protein